MRLPIVFATLEAAQEQIRFFKEVDALTAGAQVIPRRAERLAFVAQQLRSIRETLRRHGGNRSHAARALGIQRTYLIRLIRTVDVK